MSDSEDEGAFASADEGNSPKKTQQSPSPPEGNKDDKTELREANVSKDKGGNSAKAKSPPSVSTTEASKKEAERQQRQTQQTRQKKKVKGGNQQSQPKAKKVAHSDESSSTQVKTDNTFKDQNSSTETVNATKNEIAKKAVDEKKEEISQSPVTSSGSKKEHVKDVKSTSKDASESKEETAKKTEAHIEGTKDIGEEEDSSSAKKSDAAATPEKSDSRGRDGSGWGWGGWGSSLLSAATSSVQTFSHQVGDGLTTIKNTVESSLDDLVTDDKTKSTDSSEEDLSQAKSVKEEGQDTEATNIKHPKDAHQQEDKSSTGKPEDKTEASESNQESDQSGGSFFSGWGIAGIAKKVTDTGKTLASKGQTLMTDGFDAVENLASGGIDVLENIGKKTYHTFSEHDPAFKKTREYLKLRGTKPNLSSVLRDAKDQAEKNAAQMKESEEARKVHFETQLDEYQGIAHLEALEMLSNQSEKKVLSLLNSLSSDDHKEIKPILISIKEVFEVEEEEDTTADDKKDQDFSCLVNKHLSELKLGTAPDKLNKVHEMVKQWMADLETQDSYNPKAIHQQAIQSLAELTSKGVEQFHKAGELVLMQRDSEKDCNERAHSFARLTGVLCHEVGHLATKFTDILNKSVTAENEEERDVTTLITNIYLEASNSTTYIQDAFQLLLPILQQAAIEHIILASQS